MSVLSKSCYLCEDKTQFKSSISSTQRIVQNTKILQTGPSYMCCALAFKVSDDVLLLLPQCNDVEQSLEEGSKYFLMLSLIHYHDQSQQLAQVNNDQCVLWSVERDSRTCDTLSSLLLSMILL